MTAELGGACCGQTALVQFLKEDWTEVLRHAATAEGTVPITTELCDGALRRSPWSWSKNRWSKKHTLNVMQQTGSFHRGQTYKARYYMCAYRCVHVSCIYVCVSICVCESAVVNPLYLGHNVASKCFFGPGWQVWKSFLEPCNSVTSLFSILVVLVIQPELHT